MVPQVECATLSKNELRDLFTLHEDMPSHLHHKLSTTIMADEDDEAIDDDEVHEATDTPNERRPPREVEKPQEGWPKETGDMHLWRHHLGCETVEDAVLRDAGRQSAPGDGYVSFTFSLQVQGKKEVAGPMTSQAVAPVPKGVVLTGLAAAAAAAAVAAASRTGAMNRGQSEQFGEGGCQLHASGGGPKGGAGSLTARPNEVWPLGSWNAFA